VTYASCRGLPPCTVMLSSSQRGECLTIVDAHLQNTSQVAIVQRSMRVQRFMANDPASVAPPSHPRHTWNLFCKDSH